ncbi:protein diaphanous homolog 2-like [Schistocerca nitens]|uniref:protein diaphanous homolog 2-like n=1 Tax=Schistocerca nitens TaxID=7011 RepID=UPI0021183E20|nr:protein diaphanous homolog 2-like [Schistocerca nitens]
MYELRNTVNVTYKTRLLSFINCLILGCSDLQRRVCTRNKFLRCGLGPLMCSLRAIHDKELQVQVSAFTSHQHRDEMELELTKQPTPHQLFETILKKTADTPQAVWFISMLRNLAQLDVTNPNEDNIWKALDALSYEATLPVFSVYKKHEHTQQKFKKCVENCCSMNVRQSHDICESWMVSTKAEAEDDRKIKQLSHQDKQHQL